MTLNLSPEQPAPEKPPEAPLPMVGDPPAAAPQAQPAAGSRVMGVVITLDGTPLRLIRAADGGLSIAPGGRNPLILDRWQAGAFRGLVAASEEV